MNENKLSQQSLELLNQLFSTKSSLQLPVSVAELVVEIRNWVNIELRG